MIPLKNIPEMVFTLSLCSVGSILLAQSKKAEQLLPNVVAITTTFAKGYVETGFGFVVEEVNGKLILATAKHVVSEGEGEASISLRFYERALALPATIIPTETDLDLALLSCSKPEGYEWERTLEGKKPKRGHKVSFIGRDGDWYIPTEAAEGQVNRVGKEEILVDIQNVTRGTSGAPLISSSGIVGLITHTEAGIARAIEVSQLMDVVNQFYENPVIAPVSLGGKTYRTIRFSVRGPTWMAQNLDYEVADSWCYDNDPANCRKYGRLYTWEAAKRACAAVGWRLPTDAEWRSLAMSQGGLWDWKDVGNPKEAYQALIEGGSSGFSAQLGGTRDSGGVFVYLRYWGGYWSAAERDSDRAWLYAFGGTDGELNRGHGDKSYGRSCRCVQD